MPKEANTSRHYAHDSGNNALVVANNGLDADSSESSGWVYEWGWD